MLHLVIVIHWLKIETNSHVDSLGKWLPSEGEDEVLKSGLLVGKAMQRKHVFSDVIEKEATNLYLSVWAFAMVSLYICFWRSGHDCQLTYVCFSRQFYFSVNNTVVRRMITI